ncbi:hypothetical protein QQS21_001210 [Conoideocrella luteorostrata]|uniref:Chromo domain-containing protein n=1 Tax=Conoideocrella luteorostrata TaxID=1105319 RepID=A0AAJ0CXF9_9HYPO|nr:hypothetical protein QQS21_001210 [Conoideocrella luteorostrata]
METVIVIDSSDDEPWTPEPPIATTQPMKTTEFLVELKPRPRYAPGRGPALQPLRLLPPEESTVYIRERVLLDSPGLAEDGRPLPKRMTYIVGWRDLPAASLLVPAMQVLDYVSPRALEEFEDRFEAELDKQRQNNEKTMGAKLGRKAKARPPAHTDIEQATAIVAQDETLARPKTGAMSLSTPQKRKRADFDGLSDEYDSPSNQLAREMFGHGSSRGNSADMFANADDGVEERLGSQTTDTETKVKPNEFEHSKKMTPIPLPPHIIGMLDKQKPLSEDESKKSSVGLQADDFLAPASRNDLVPSIEGGTFSSGTGSSLISGDNGIATSPVTRGSTRELRGSTSTSRKRSSDSSKKPLPSKQSPKKRKHSPLVKQVIDSQATWEVERLEDSNVYDVEGRGFVRYFLVRWAGDWPPEQQTTWEPEEHIPREMVRAYMKIDKKRRAKRAAQSRRDQKRNHLFMAAPSAAEHGWAVATRYSSVSDAFEGDTGKDEGPGDAPSSISEDQNPYLGEHELDSEVFVVEGSTQTTGNYGANTPITLPYIIGA